ncbi:MAG: AAA family ATPase [Candidatus Methanoplasma sp.]|jgi:dephospho-CoA kinase|nr:AAA family ATPase [Candidatus Methanoplasma sp.]
MLIILITGMPGSGKEELLSVARGLGISFLRMGDLVREYHGLSGENVTVGEFASLERNRHGPGIWAERAIERMTGELFLIDGCRSFDEVREFRKLSGNVKIVAIHSPPDQRYERLLKRQRADAPGNKEEFDARDRRELSWGLGEVIALADIVIDNSSSLADFQSRSERTLKAIK